VVSLVSPFRDLRELLKNNTKHTVKEIYLHSSRLREGKMVEYYEPPLNNYLDIDTDKYTIEESIKLITHYIQ
jgi:adenylylsulfate kinase-like enzyme